MEQPMNETVSVFTYNDDVAATQETIAKVAKILELKVNGIDVNHRQLNAELRVSVTGTAEQIKEFLDSFKGSASSQGEEWLSGLIN
jgi:GTP-dependent phosphoenolpyruvate carboxykinase